MSYTGIFIRQVQGQKPTDPSNGSCGCPDIIFNGQVDAGDPRQFATDSSYAWTSPADVTLQNPNFVYLRGYQSNTTNGSNLFFYSVPSSLALWPQNWSGANVQVGSNKQPQNWSYAPAVANSPYVVNSQALVWTPPDIDTNVQHYCTVIWADNSTKDNPIPPNFARLGNLYSFDQLMHFLSITPNMGWRNTSDHKSPPPQNTYTTYVATKDKPETALITVYFDNISDGTFMVNLTGDVGWSSGSTPLNVSNYLGGYSINKGNGVPFGPNQQSMLMVTYNPGTTPVSKYAAIRAEIVHQITGVMMNTMLSIAAQPGVVLPIKHMVLGAGALPKPVFTLGQQQWNLKFGTA